MRRVLFAVAGFALCAVAIAQEPKPAPQPVPAPKVAAQPNPFPARPATATRLAALEEEVETLEAHRDVKKAYLRAAEVSVKLTERTYQLLKKQVDSGAASHKEFAELEMGYETAKALVEIRAAELREVEVKIKHAKKRWEDAKATAKPAAPPAKGVDPQP